MSSVGTLNIVLNQNTAKALINDIDVAHNSFSYVANQALVLSLVRDILNTANGLAPITNQFAHNVSSSYRSRLLNTTQLMLDQFHSLDGFVPQEDDGNVRLLFLDVLNNEYEEQQPAEIANNLFLSRLNKFAHLADNELIGNVGVLNVIIGESYLQEPSSSTNTVGSPSTT